MSKPQTKFKPIPEEKYSYKYVSYRLRTDSVNELKKYVSKDMSASKLVDQLIRWGLKGQKGKSS